MTDQFAQITWVQFFIIFAVCSVTILVCRVVPLFALKGRQLPARVTEALSFIPPAAFAALVANDLFAIEKFEVGLWEGAMPFVASLAVVLVAWKTKSLLWSAVTGVVAYALLMFATSGVLGG